MTKLHLNYDGTNLNGVIFNDKYPNGAMYKGEALKPVLSFKYLEFGYSERFNLVNFVRGLDGHKRLMTDEQIEEIVALATAWEQALGQEGNPTLEQAKNFKTIEILDRINTDVLAITPAQPHEMTSWRKQEEQARAYIADVTAITPLLDALKLSRDNSETKLELSNKIVSNADAYELAYGTILGKHQNLTVANEIATTVEQVNAIIW